jgi:hypothetical protein
MWAAWAFTKVPALSRTSIAALSPTRARTFWHKPAMAIHVSRITFHAPTWNNSSPTSAMLLSQKRKMETTDEHRSTQILPGETFHAGIILFVQLDSLLSVSICVHPWFQLLLLGSWNNFSPT